MSTLSNKTTAKKEMADTQAGQVTTLNHNNKPSTSNSRGDNPSDLLKFLISRIDGVNSAEAQRFRLMAWLNDKSSITTIEARRELDILMPAARVHELRHTYGKNITTIWTHQPTACGKIHRVARYVLGASEPSLFDEGV